MQVLKIKEKYNIIDLSIETNVVNLLNIIILEKTHHIFLDLTGCEIDYPSTSKLIDKLLFHLSEVPNDKKLTIKTNYKLKPELIYSLLFLGSDFLHLSTKYLILDLEWENLFEKIKSRNFIEIILEF